MNKLHYALLSAVTLCGVGLYSSCSNETNTQNVKKQTVFTTIGNPYLPLWEHIPDGEPYVFDDPDNPGKKRVYIYGSHDSRITDYCGRELVVWSASVDSLTKWRYDGEIFSVTKNALGEPYEQGNVLFAPDVALKIDSNGEKTYYLYPNNQEGGRQGMVAKSKRPDGPFEVCNWSKENPDSTVGVLRFDPAVFVDDDGKVYGYWGFGNSMAAELDPETMATVKPGTKIVEDMVSGWKQDGVFRFFEASSIRKIKDKYVFIYSRWTKDGDFSMPETNYTLAYAYSDFPLGPYTFGGTIIDGRGRETSLEGKPIATGNPSGNTHGSICEINNQWYVFYHRQNGLNEFSRQAMVAPITVNVEEGKGGKVMISEGEYNSEGFSINGLDPLELHPAGIACWYTGSKPAVHEWPNNVFYGPYVEAAYGTNTNFQEPYAVKNNINPVVHNTDGSILGYKYFNFSSFNGKKNIKLILELIPQGIDGEIEVFVDRPWESQGGKKVGELQIKNSMSQTSTQMTVDVSDLKDFSGKHALFFIIKSATKDKSICSFETLQFLTD